MLLPELPFHNLAARHYGLTEAIAETFTEAARVCLDRHHQPPVEFSIDFDGARYRAGLQWVAANTRMQYAWDNSRETTEKGSCALVLSVVELVQGLVTVRRAETGTGVDYYVALPGTDPEDLEDCIRLEISGLDRGNANAVRGRLREKKEQAAAGDANLPAMAGVTGFLARTILLSNVEAP